MRTRSIKPSFFNNEILGDLPSLTRLLFIGLWCMADREGRLEDRPKRIKKELLGYDDLNAEDVNGMLQELHNNGFIVRYNMQNKNYIQIVKFSKHQNPHIREKDSEIPPPLVNYKDEACVTGDACTVLIPDNNEKSTEEAPLVPDYLLPTTDHCIPTPSDTHVHEGTPESSNAKKETKQKRFDLFWMAYPKKVGKKEALKAWDKAKVDSALFDKIMTAIGRARATEQWRRDGGRWIPNPSTWLNQGRWDDEYEEVNPDGNPKKPDGNPNPASGKTYSNIV
ncbi:MAG: hypothetical protein LBS36_07590 [Oscillospiraceae bacterium]|jgi:hypothetical protein|nr:hypothetical protein [Oscillospiraceae bacterium]